MSRHIHLLLLIVLLLSGCEDKESQERAKWRQTLGQDDKRPYGTWLAHESLKYYFSGAKVETLSGKARFNNMDDVMKYANAGGHGLLILEGFDFYLSDEEWKQLKGFIKAGNEVFIFSNVLDNKIEQDLQCYMKNNETGKFRFLTSDRDLDNKFVLSLQNNRATDYGYTGRNLKGYFDVPVDAPDTVQRNTDDTDSAIKYSEWPYPDTLGYAQTEPDFIRYRLGEGHLTLHAAPLVLSNYFLLQDGNEQYLTGIWQTLPENVTHVYWVTYGNRTQRSSGMSVLWKYPATKYAILLALLALLVYVLFEGKRKQRIIPVIAPLRNDSVSFVETVGRLYYNKGNHANLAAKMTLQFLEWVRTHYYLNTNLLNEEFIMQLAMKSGHTEATVRGLMDIIHEVRMGTALVDDAYLYQLYSTIQQFYKNEV